ncbi:unnamed protein product [Symbiodinium sp. CCMP2456]|nr:unnamed protein product [Symbiodinium sp. CCMP2456]
MDRLWCNQATVPKPLQTQLGQSYEKDCTQKLCKKALDGSWYGKWREYKGKTLRWPPESTKWGVSGWKTMAKKLCVEKAGLFEVTKTEEHHVPYFDKSLCKS